ncbi:HEPN domain containing protein (plasmid) [Halanaeroarchaeum sp. HSR-CO]|nr:HEPN domain containing protein [Halanaeroarchaeum sp. HSR-CO]
MTAPLARAEDAFEYIGKGKPTFEDGIDQDEEWTTQLTKACKYLEACRTLRSQNGFNGAVIELSFSAIERSLEGYLLQDTKDSIADYLDHEFVYERAGARGLFTRDTAQKLKELYGTNRTEHYYGKLAPTQEKADAMFELAEGVHQHVTDQINNSGVCLCD